MRGLTLGKMNETSKEINMESGIQQAFFSTRNRNMLNTMIERDMQNLRKKPLSTSQKQRIASITDHYMKEVYKVQGNKPLAFLNKETIAISEKQFQRSKHVPATEENFTSTVREHESQKKVTFASVVATGSSSTSSSSKPLYTDTSTLFEKTQQIRIDESKADIPTIPDFRTMVDDEKMPSASELFERAKARREKDNQQQPQQSTNIYDLEMSEPVGMDLVNSYIMPQVQQTPSPALRPHQVVIKENDTQSYREIESNL